MSARRRGREHAIGTSAGARSASTAARRIDRRDWVERDRRRRGASASNGKAATLAGGVAHDVSILLGVGRHLGSQPHANTSITIMRAHSAGMGRAVHVGRPARHLAAFAGRRQAGRHQQCAGRRDTLGAVGVGKEPVVADAVEALG